MADLRTKLGRLQLENPIIISSGHVTRTWDDIIKCDRYGAGAIVAKSTFLEEEYEKVVRPYGPGLFPDARAKFHSTGDGYLTICGLSPVPVETWAKWFKDNLKDIKTPVIASIMAISAEGYVKAARMFLEAGAEAIEILLACPLPYLLPHPYVGGASFNPAIVEEVCREVRRAVDIPLGVKLMFNPLDTSPLKIPKKEGLDWMTIAMAFLAAPGIRLNEIKPELPSSVFISGSSVGKHANFVSLLNLQDQYKDIHISATGGIRNWKDVVEYIMYGAGSVQTQTLFLQKGLGLIEGFKKDISDYMDAKGFASVEEMKGVILPELLSFDEVISSYSETKGKIFASVDQRKCTCCGLCEEVCNWQAIRVSDGKRLEIIRDKCEGCGVCVCCCPQEALLLQNVNAIREIARG
ncbi:MAG: hypothetical protein SV775_11460 [Thermodesulfobacteriota bacterium]|nr:hypothetical protein [Thermodesulfobacteriota bacterium]